MKTYKKMGLSTGDSRSRNKGWLGQVRREELHHITGWAMERKMENDQVVDYGHIG
jgi:hypothetical protein